MLVIVLVLHQSFCQSSILHKKQNKMKKSVNDSFAENERKFDALDCTLYCYRNWNCATLST